MRDEATAAPSSHSAGVRTDRILDHDTRAATGRIEQREGGISYRSQEKLCLMQSQETDYSYTRRLTPPPATVLRGHTHCQPIYHVKEFKICRSLNLKSMWGDQLKIV